METSGTPSCRRFGELVRAVESSKEFLRNQEKGCRAGDLHLAFVAEKEVTKGRARKWNPGLRHVGMPPTHPQ